MIYKEFIFTEFDSGLNSQLMVANHAYFKIQKIQYSQSKISITTTKI